MILDLLPKLTGRALLYARDRQERAGRSKRFLVSLMRMMGLDTSQWLRIGGWRPASNDNGHDPKEGL